MNSWLPAGAASVNTPVKLLPSACPVAAATAARQTTMMKVHMPQAWFSAHIHCQSCCAITWLCWGRDGAVLLQGYHGGAPAGNLWRRRGRGLWLGVQRPLRRGFRPHPRTLLRLLRAIGQQRLQLRTADGPEI